MVKLMYWINFGWMTDDCRVGRKQRSLSQSSSDSKDAADVIKLPTIPATWDRTRQIGTWHVHSSSLLKSVRLAVWIVEVRFHSQASSTTLLPGLNIALLWSNQWNPWNKKVDNLRMLHCPLWSPVLHKNSTNQDSSMGAWDHQIWPVACKAFWLSPD
jgi:hypothetical protein